MSYLEKYLNIIAGLKKTITFDQFCRIKTNELRIIEEKIFMLYNFKIKKMFNIYKIPYKENIGEFYIYFLKALYYFDPNKSDFFTYLNFWIIKLSKLKTKHLDFIEYNDGIKNITVFKKFKMDEKTLKKYKKIEKIIDFELTGKESSMLKMYFGINEEFPLSFREIKKRLEKEGVCISHTSVRLILIKSLLIIKNCISDKELVY